MKYFVLYQLDIINNSTINTKKLSKIITLDEVTEEEIWSKLDIPNNHSSKLILNIVKL